MKRIDRNIMLICLVMIPLGLGSACSKFMPHTAGVSNTPSPQTTPTPANELTSATDPTCCGLMSVGNQGIDTEWSRFTADGHYRLALKDDLKSPAREFGSDALNSIFAYCWGQLGTETVKNHLAAIVVDTRRNDADRFGLVIFSAAEARDGSYKPYWIYQKRDLSRSVVWTGSGDLMVADYKEDGSREVSFVHWDKLRRRFVTSKSRPRPS